MKTNVLKKEVGFEGKTYDLVEFNYLNGKNGLLFQNSNNPSEYFAASLSMDNINQKQDEVLIKDHDFNKGVLACLIKHDIISKQFRTVKLGFNDVYLCIYNKRNE